MGRDGPLGVRRTLRRSGRTLGRRRSGGLRRDLLAGVPEGVGLGDLALVAPGADPVGEVPQRRLGVGRTRCCWPDGPRRPGLGGRSWLLDRPGRLHRPGWLGGPDSTPGGALTAGGRCHPPATLGRPGGLNRRGVRSVSYTHLRAHETVLDLVCRLLLEK